MLVDILPRTFGQIMCMIMVYIANGIFNAILFGVYFDLLEEARKKENEFQGQVDNANTAMANLELSDKITEKIRNYILQTWETKTQQEEYVKFEEKMPPSYNMKINTQNFKKQL